VGGELKQTVWRKETPYLAGRRRNNSIVWVRKGRKPRGGKGKRLISLTSGKKGFPKIKTGKKKKRAGRSGGVEKGADPLKRRDGGGNCRYNLLYEEEKAVFMLKN